MGTPSRAILCCLALILTCPSTLAAQSQENGESSTTPVATLAPGDVLRVTVWRQPELSGEFAVATDGTLVHPLYREVRVAGLPMSEVGTRIGTLLSRYAVSPRYVVEARFRVAVGGEVRQPSLYSLPPETTISQAVALAGGPTDRGRLDQVQVWREGEVLELDLARSDLGVAGLRIRSGDRIIVGRRSAFFRDFVTPVAAVAAAVGAVVNIFLSN